MVNNLTFEGLNYNMQAFQDPTFSSMMDKLENATDPMKVIEALERIDAIIDKTIMTTYRNLKSTPKHLWVE
eukprot:5300164-Ditylum_brightwellii.AAC.2